MRGSPVTALLFGTLLLDILISLHKAKDSESNEIPGTGKMAQWLTALAVNVEYLGSVPSTRVVAHNHL